MKLADLHPPSLRYIADRSSAEAVALIRLSAEHESADVSDQLLARSVELRDHSRWLRGMATRAEGHQVPRKPTRPPPPKPERTPGRHPGRPTPDRPETPRAMHVRDKRQRARLQKILKSLDKDRSKS